MRTLYLVSKRLPRVCMGGSIVRLETWWEPKSAPRVHGWFHARHLRPGENLVCPACAWVVPEPQVHFACHRSLPRVCMGGSMLGIYDLVKTWSAPRVHGWFPVRSYCPGRFYVCPACAWVVPKRVQLG